ncbi:MAG: HEPN domain-containing protein [Candidatus Desantisbacteria bacterium]
METRRSKEELKSLIEGYMKSSYERLSSAKLLLDAEKFRDSISRSYYAFLDAADALLLTKDLRPKSHSGTLRLFSQYFIKEGILDRKYSRWFKRIEKARLEADYERAKEFTQEETKEAFEEAKKFVETIEKLLQL